jgi:hypothetical protein
MNKEIKLISEAYLSMLHSGVTVAESTGPHPKVPKEPEFYGEPDRSPEVGQRVIRETDKGKAQSGTIKKITKDKVHVLYHGQKEETVHDHADLDQLPKEFRPQGYKDHGWATYHTHDGHNTTSGLRK